MSKTKIEKYMPMILSYRDKAKSYGLKDEEKLANELLKELKGNEENFDETKLEVLNYALYKANEVVKVKKYISEDIVPLEQAYLDADNALYNARLEAADDYGEKYIQAQQELYNTISEIDQAWQDGEYASYDEYLAARKAAFDHYEKLIVQYQGIYNNIFADNASWITDFTTDESRRLTGNVIDDVEGLQENIYADSRLMKGHIIDSAGMMSSAWEENMLNMDGKTEGWRDSTDQYLKDVDGYFTDLQKDIKKEIETSGGHFTAFKDIITPTNKTSKDSIDSLKTATSNVVEQSKNLTEMLTKEGGLIDALDEEITFVGNVTTAYQTHRAEVQGLSSDYQQLAEDVNKALLAEQNKKNWNESSSNESDNSKNTDTSKNNNNSNNNAKKEITVGGGVKASSSAYIYKQVNGVPEGQYYWQDPNYTVLQENGEWVLVRHHSLSSGNTGWFKKSDLSAYDTGGYTGSWGSYGKMALLHEKELILNAGDTENFLASMELLDSIVKTIDLYSANAQWGGILSTPAFGSYGSEPIQQNITIEAHFPDATDRNEIEEAFKSLGNLASQYITKY